jgi:hypothetical protein
VSGFVRIVSWQLRSLVFYMQVKVTFSKVVFLWFPGRERERERERESKIEKERKRERKKVREEERKRGRGKERER